MKPKSERAFTLVELLCVLALLGMITLIAVPAVGGLGRSHNVELAARTLAMDMRKSQQKAITKGWSQSIEFRMHNDDYNLKDDMTSERVRVRLPEGVTFQGVHFPKVGGYRLLRFHRSGAPNRGGTVSLANAAGDVYYVIVTPATGRVRVSDSPPD